MALAWDWHCGFEVGPQNPLAPTLADLEQDLWEAQITGILTASGRTGNWSCRVPPAGFGLDLEFIGHRAGVTDDFVFWIFSFDLSGWASGEHSEGDFYSLTRFVDDWNASGLPYLGAGLQIAADTTEFYIAVNQFTALGASQGIPVIVGTGGPYDTSTGWIAVLVTQDISGGEEDGLTKLWVSTGDAFAQDGDDYPAGDGWYRGTAILKDNQHIGGKGSDRSPTVDVDDMGGAVGSSEGDKPTYEYGIQLYQMALDYDQEWSPSVGPDHFREIDDEKQGPTCPAGGSLASTEIGDDDSWETPNLVSGTVEAVRIKLNTGNTVLAHVGAPDPFETYVPVQGDGLASWWGYQFVDQPEGAGWADFDTIRWGVRAVAHPTFVSEYYAEVMGVNVGEAPLNLCAPAFISQVIQY